MKTKNHLLESDLVELLKILRLHMVFQHNGATYFKELKRIEVRLQNEIENRKEKI